MRIIEDPWFCYKSQSVRTVFTSKFEQNLSTKSRSLFTCGTIRGSTTLYETLVVCRSCVLISRNAPYPQCRTGVNTPIGHMPIWSLIFKVTFFLSNILKCRRIMTVAGKWNINCSKFKEMIKKRREVTDKQLKQVKL